MPRRPLPPGAGQRIAVISGETLAKFQSLPGMDQATLALCAARMAKIVRRVARRAGVA